MISTVLCGRFYKIFVSPMLHKKSSASAGLFLCSKLFSPPRFALPLPNPKITKQVNVALEPLEGTLGCFTSQIRRAEHRDPPPGCLECGSRCSANFRLAPFLAQVVFL